MDTSKTQSKVFSEAQVTEIESEIKNMLSSNEKNVNTLESKIAKMNDEAKKLAQLATSNLTRIDSFPSMT